MLAATVRLRGSTCNSGVVKLSFQQRASWACSLFVALLLALPAPAYALEAVTLQLKWTHAFQFAGYYAAQVQGYYREAGLEVTIKEGLPGVDVVQAVLDGSANYGVGTSSLLLARKEGKPVVALAVVFQHSPQVLIARQTSATQSIHDLAGKRIMLEQQSEELLAYLKRVGVAPGDLTQVAHSYDVQDLIEGKADAMSAYSTNEPYALTRAGVRFQTYTPRSAGIDFYGDNLFTSAQELKDHPQRVAAFRQASLRGWQYAMAHPAELVDWIVANYLQHPSHEFLLFEAAEMAPLLRTDLIEVGYMNPGRWQHIADTYADLGLLPPNFSLEGFLYNPNPVQDLTRLYVLAALLVLVSVIGGYIYRINRRLTASMVESERAKDALAQAFTRVERAESEHRQLLSMASHEFRTPAAMIKASLDSLDYLHDQIAPEVAQRLANIGQASMRLNKLANNLISQDRLQELALKPQMQDIELGPLVREVVGKYLASDLLQMHLPQHPVVVFADPVLLGIALHNLIDNAMRYHKATNAPIEVALTEGRDTAGQWVELRVADQGAGVANDEKERVFQRFYSAKGGDSDGLGLSIVQAVALAHGGSAFVVDNLPRGAVFVLRLAVRGKAT